jgi:hypothetical protein
MKLKIGNGLVWESNPVLQGRKPLSVPPLGRTKDQLNDVIKFVHFLVDPDDSPLATERDFEYRRSRAYELAGMKKNHIGDSAECFGEEFNDVTDWIGDVMTEYLKMVNATLYETWFSMKMNLFQTNQMLRKPLGTDKDGNSEKLAKDRDAITANITDRAMKVLELESVLFSSVKEISDAATKSSIEKSLAGFAELNAEELADDIERMSG